MSTAQSARHDLWDNPMGTDGFEFVEYTGPDPHELVLMALGACTTITVRIYAARKGWPIEKLDVRLSFRPLPAGAPRPEREQIDRKIELVGPLDAEQRERLFQIAEKCPIHKLLTAGVDIHSELLP